MLVRRAFRLGSSLRATGAGVLNARLLAQGTAVTPRATNVSSWYQDVLRQARLVDSSPVRGCFVLMPRGYAIWERLRQDFDRRFAATGVVNCYFPLFVPLSFFRKEAEHVEGFAKECAVVTHTRLNASLQPDEEARLQEPLVVRPTSETVVWDSVRRWVGTRADLPVLLNQWANVVRWERRTRPFLRTSEFLWQEGHTAHASRLEAWHRATRMIELYATAARETLALPTVMGTKSASERFAGAAETLTIEAMMCDGWALQCGTSHFLGTSFSEAFGVHFEDADSSHKPVWATSWGVSTRLMGAMVMSHSDDTGFVCPPAVAPVQVEVVPVAAADGAERVLAACEGLVRTLRASGLRAELDTLVRDLSGRESAPTPRKGAADPEDDHHSDMGGLDEPGVGEQANGVQRPAAAAGGGRRSLGKRRFASERRGTPLRVEVGLRELEAGLASARPRLSLSREAVRRSVAEVRAAGGLAHHEGEDEASALLAPSAAQATSVGRADAKGAGSSSSSSSSSGGGGGEGGVETGSALPPLPALSSVTTAPTTVLMTQSDPASLLRASGDAASLTVRHLMRIADALNPNQQQQDSNRPPPLSLQVPLDKPAEAVAAVRAGLQAVHATMLLAAEARLEERTTWVTLREDFVEIADRLSRSVPVTHDDEEEDDDNNGGGGGGFSDEAPSDGVEEDNDEESSVLEGPAFVLAPWHDEAEAEAEVKAATKMTIRCFPAKYQTVAKDAKCFWTDRPATHIALFARAY